MKSNNIHILPLVHKGETLSIDGLEGLFVEYDIYAAAIEAVRAGWRDVPEKIVVECPGQVFFTNGDRAALRIYDISDEQTTTIEQDHIGEVSVGGISSVELYGNVRIS